MGFSVYSTSTVTTTTAAATTTMSSQYRGRRQWLLQALVSILLLFLRTAAAEGIDEEIVVEADPFLLRIFPKPDDFSLEKRVTVLWTVENIVREYFEEEFEDSSETLYIGSGITGLSLVPPDEDTTDYETIKFLGGAVAFHPASTVTPSKNDLQKSIRQALRQDSVKTRLNIYFPDLQQVVYVPLVLGNRGFAVEEEVVEEEVVEEISGNDNMGVSQEKPEDVKLTPNEFEGSDPNDANDREVAGFQSSSNSNGRNNAKKTTIGLSAGVAMGGAVIVLLIALLIESQRRRMELWREGGRSCASSIDGLSEEKPAKKMEKSTSQLTSNYYADDEQETTLRLPRIWGVSPTQRMGSGTARSSDVSASLEGEDILTCTSVDRRSIRNVESFEHQKRLVDTLKKEMMASNAEIHPYMQDTHLDQTEPCALSPTDLSAAALENQVLTQPVSTWHAPSDSSFTGSGSGASGYDSPSSPLQAMMGALRKSSGSKDTPSRGKRSQYDSDRAEL